MPKRCKCGGHPDVHKTSRGKYWLECNCCWRASDKFWDIDSAVADWDRRAAADGGDNSMAELKFTYSEMRPCTVNGRKALFHRWADKAQTVGESPMRGGPAGGQLWCVVGIVEYDDGTVHEAYPHEIKFEDR